MITTLKPIVEMTAADLMTRDMICVPQDMSMKQAARLLIEHRISGAPVVDERGRLVGVISNSDFVALANMTEMPVSCGFQGKYKTAAGAEIATCTLPMDTCPYQKKQTTADGKDIIACVQSHCVCTEWEVVPVEDLPSEAVRQFMTADPVLVPGSTSIARVARQMIDAHIHRMVVVDAAQRPVGIVTSTDLLAALAYSEGPYEPNHSAPLRGTP